MRSELIGASSLTRWHYRVMVVLCFVIAFSRIGLAVTWEEQAKRLQLVSASFLDTQPILSNVPGEGGRFHLEAKSVISALPKLNTTVGAKSEEAPQPPAHGVPTVEVNFVTKRSAYGNALMRIWGGFLPASSSRFVGMDAACEQSLRGISLGFRDEDMGLLSSTVEVGAQWGAALVKGGITEKAANDLFRVSSRLQFLSMTFSFDQLPSLWFQGQVAERRVYTYFNIPSDGTTFNFKDSSTLKSGSATSQFSVGYDFGGGFQVAAGYTNIPQRSTLPRLLVSYGRHLGKSKLESETVR